MIIGPQIRAARALLNWSADDLSQKIGATRQTVLRLEQTAGVPSTKLQTMSSIIHAFEEAGVEFTGSPESGAGVRFRVDINR